MDAKPLVWSREPSVMAEVVELPVLGMTCMGCAGSVQKALEAVSGVDSAEVTIDPGLAKIFGGGSGVGSSGGATTGVALDRAALVSAVLEAGYTIEGEAGTAKEAPAMEMDMGEYNWTDKGIWKQSFHNTKWCLAGCAIGEFGTLAYYSYSGITAGLTLYSTIWYLYAILPLINGLATSVMLETFILMRGQMPLGLAFKTAMGMSFISMLMMEISMEVTDLLFTGGELGMNFYAIPLMLVVGFLTPWPYNYWRLKKYGMACH